MITAIFLGTYSCGFMHEWAVVIIIGAIVELERNLIIERVRAGMRRAKLEGRHIGRKPLVLDRNAILRDRQRGQSLSQLAKGPPCLRRHHPPRASAARSNQPGEVGMKETIAILLSTGLGVTAGRLLGNEILRRKNAKTKAENLRLHAPTLEHQLKEMRSVLNDAR